MVPIDILKAECTLSWDGIHGIHHWRRVRAIGIKLAPKTGASIELVELFAFLHDLKRVDDGLKIENFNRYSISYEASNAATFIGEKGDKAAPPPRIMDMVLSYRNSPFPERPLFAQMEVS